VKARVLVIVPFPVAPGELAARAAQSSVVRLDPGMDLHHVPVLAAPHSFDSYLDYALADVAIAEAGVDAERAGYDAVCVDTMSDSGVAALRSVLDIPVIGTGRTAYTLALQCCEHFSILAMWSVWYPMYKKTLGELGIADRCVSMRAPEVQPDNRKLLAGREEEVLPLLLDAAWASVHQDGAEAIVLGSTTMHGAHRYLSDRLDVPVVNPGPASYRFAQLSLELGLAHSRRTYRASRIPSTAIAHRMLASAERREA
jgi:allantoin racemase